MIVMHSVGTDSYDGDLGYQKPCRACTNFKSWAKSAKEASKKGNAQPSPETKESQIDHSNCPLDKDELGRRTWGFLHTMAAYYPEKPTDKQSSEMKQFFHTFSNFYPCDHCAADFRKDISKNPPKTDSQSNLSQWLCNMHNIVNLKLGKPAFDCTKVNQRWRDGWLDGSCD